MVESSELGFVSAIEKVPPGRRVLFTAALEVKPGETLDIHLSLSATPIGDPTKDQRCGILTVHWLDRDDNLVPNTAFGFRATEEYGPFTYVPHENETSIAEFHSQLRVPRHVSRAVIRLMPFANPTLSLISALTTRLAG